jgi:hypothetical protein
VAEALKVELENDRQRQCNVPGILRGSLTVIPAPQVISSGNEGFMSTR